MTRQIKESTKLKGQKRKTEVRHSSMKAVINVSSRHLEISEESVPNKGINVATPIKRIKGIIATIEKIALKILKDTKNRGRGNKVESETGTREIETLQTKRNQERKPRYQNTAK